MKALRAVVIAVLAGCAVAPAGADSALGRGAPEELGVSSAAILSFLDAANKIDAMNSVVILRHGRVIARAQPLPYCQPPKGVQKILEGVPRATRTHVHAQSVAGPASSPK